MADVVVCLCRCEDGLEERPAAELDEEAGPVANDCGLVADPVAGCGVELHRDAVVAIFPVSTLDRGHRRRYWHGPPVERSRRVVRRLRTCGFAVWVVGRAGLCEPVALVVALVVVAWRTLEEAAALDARGTRPDQVDDQAVYRPSDVKT